MSPRISTTFAFLLITAAAALAACGGDDAAPEREAGPASDAARDAEPLDGAPADAGPSEAGPTDAGPSEDATPPPRDLGPEAAPPLDAAPGDAAPEDAQPSDAPSCPPPTGSGCTYVRTPGSARVVALETPGSSEYSCRNDPVRVVLDFTPDDPAARACYTVPGSADEGYHLTVGAGANPSRSCVEALGLALGEVVTAVRADIVTGTCTPVTFEHPGLDLDRCAMLCDF